VFDNGHCCTCEKDILCISTVERQLTDWCKQVITWRDLRGLLYSHSYIVCVLILSNSIELQPSISILAWVAWLFDHSVYLMQNTNSLFHVNAIFTQYSHVTRTTFFPSERTASDWSWLAHEGTWQWMRRSVQNSTAIVRVAHVNVTASCDCMWALLPLLPPQVLFIRCDEFPAREFCDITCVS
jgi:hypothetical protein